MINSAITLVTVHDVDVKVAETLSGFYSCLEDVLISGVNEEVQET